MKFFNYIKIVFKNYIRNFHIIGKYDLSTIFQQPKEFEKLKELLYLSRRQNILLYYDIHKEQAKAYEKELQYLQEHSIANVFPYEQEKTIQSPIIADIDKKNNLPFILHKNKRLYFPRELCINDAILAYKNFIERENLLGGGYTSCAPHQYITDSFKIEKNDILLDIGCAEGLVALDSIDLVKEVYLFEGDMKWIEAINATFYPYKEKVHIIPKYVDNFDSKNTIKLDNLFSHLNNQSFFIKMDIEGAEHRVLSSSKDFFNSNNNIKLACCLYHNQQDEKEITSLLKSWKYNLELSSGYMIFYYDKNFDAPFFRKGMVRAIK